MDLSELSDLPVLPLRIAARAVEPVVLPPNAGSTLRGAFGAALRGLVCVYPDRARCAGCELEDACAYPALFEPRAPEGEAGLSGFRDLPRPYVIRGGPGGDAIPPGAAFAWGVTLVGEAIRCLPYFVLAWREMGTRGVGRGGGRFDLEEVTAQDAEGRAAGLLFDGATGELWEPERAAGPFTPAAADDPAELEITFLTPTSLKHAGRPAARPEFPILWNALQRRLSILRLAYGAGRPAVDFRASLRAAEAVRLESWSARAVNWERYSLRQDRRVPMGGFLGTARYAGPLTPFLPSLRLGALVGVGDNCTFGQGAYKMVEGGR